METLTAEVLHFTDEKFKQEVLESDKPVLVDFTASWCGPCRIIAPIIEEMAGEYAGRAVIGKMDVDENPETAMNYGIRGVPTIMFFKGGQIVDQMVGAAGKDKIVAKLEAQL